MTDLTTRIAVAIHGAAPTADDGAEQGPQQCSGAVHAGLSAPQR